MEREERENLVRELIAETRGRLDGGKKNIIVPTCPFCNKSGGKYGIYIGADTGNKRMWMSHCFKCGATTATLPQLLETLGRMDLMVEDSININRLTIPDWLKPEDDEIDDSLIAIQMPEGYKRCYRNTYLRQRGFTADDYEYFQVGTTRGLNWKYDNYVLFPILDEGETVGYVGRHTWSKDEIDNYNTTARRNRKYEIRRYNNSTENDFVKLLYNYDAIIEDETDTVILCEGVFDVIALTRKLDLYDNHLFVPVATFGKKISLTQIYKIQSKGVKTVVIGYDSDARSGIIKAAETLSDYFDVYIAHIDADGKDWDEMSPQDILHVISDNLYTLRNYQLSTI
jgi:DNA primase